MTEQYRKRVKGILETLGGLRLLYEQPVSHLYAAPGAYPLCTEFHKEMLDGWKPFASGETWGGGDTHWWFYGKVEIPAHYDGKKVILSLSTGATDIWNTDNPQIIAYVNGKMAATLDMNHTRIILSEKARAGEVYETAFYAYSNLSEKTNFFSLSQAVLDEKTEELYYDMKVLWEAADLLREDEEERIRIFEALNRCVNLLDLRETGSERFYASVEEADQFIKKEYERAEKKASDPAVVHSVGHTHIDVAWKWPLRQTRQKAVRSFLTVLNLMEQYPEYRFMSSQPQLYQYVKEEAPELYEQIKERVREGRWEPEGAMWVEADCNLSSGESLIRQLLHGKRFFQEEFGKGDNEVLWLPDVFGYSVALPQILRKSGIKYFMTTKIGWNEYNQIPNDTMMWRGLDGSEVLTYFITTSDYCTYPELRKKRNFSTTYNGLQNARQIMGTWQRYQNKALNQDVLTCYGYGDGGGGTTPEMLEESRRLESAPGKCPKVRQTSVKEFFHLLEKNLEGRQVPKWSGELYLEFHRGTYTSMARNKKENRKCEFLLAWAESLCVLACRQAPEFSYPDEELDRAWKLVLLNQFHDILPGSSIREVYEDSRVQYQEVHRILDAVIRRAEDAVFSAQGLERAESQTGN
ncbi:MAG: alpha-mannosidase, partial [Lachnospiraceae bacterium]|nr:alpha-mannosidase [Lachnospiraceae bacterium]